MKIVQSSVKKVINRPSKLLSLRINNIPLATRRVAAWAVEVSLLATSALVPYSLGVFVQSRSIGEPVPLNRVVATSQQAIAKTLAIPVRDSHRQQVPPLTNLFWCGALVLPLAWTAWQLYLLGKTGQTSPKRWFGVKIYSLSGAPPGILRAVIREGAGRWGWCLGAAYLVWRYSGAFPDGGILLGLTGLMLLGDAAYGWLKPDHRTLHDRLTGTFALNANYPKTTVVVNQDGSQIEAAIAYGEPVKLELQNGWVDPDEPESLTNSNGHKITTIVLTSIPNWRQLNLWRWMRHHPGTTLLIVSLGAVVTVLGTFVGTQVYIQSQTNWREANQQGDEMYRSLVRQIDKSTNSPHTLEKQRSAILALGTINDARAIKFLANLLGEEDEPSLINAIQQALVFSGTEALPYLQKLNISLKKDQEVLRSVNKPQDQKLLAWRQQATQRAIAKILTLYNDQVHNANLNSVHLAATNSKSAPFTLVLDRLDLSGINFKNAILTKASFQGTRFNGAGDDGRLGTFDDWIANLSGAEIKQANLTSANLSEVELIRANLTRAILSEANLSDANLTEANLSSSKLVNANLSQAELLNARLTGADLGSANFTQANLQAARLIEVSAIATQFLSANLKQTIWQGADLTEANFSNANLRNSDLSSTKLVSANLSQAQLQNANLQNADLRSADLRGANLDGANFQGVIFIATKPNNSDQLIQAVSPTATAAQIKNVNFSRVKNLDTQQINFICAQGGRHPKCR